MLTIHNHAFGSLWTKGLTRLSCRTQYASRLPDELANAGAPLANWPSSPARRVVLHKGQIDAVTLSILAVIRALTSSRVRLYNRLSQATVDEIAILQSLSR